MARGPLFGLLRVAPVALAAASLCACVGSSGGPPDQHAVAVYDVANDEFRKGHLRQALGKVNEAIDLDSHYAEAEHLGAIIYLAFCSHDDAASDCRYADAEKLARRAVDHDPDNREAKNTLGVILIHEKKLDAAIDVLKPLTADILYGSPQTSWGNLGWAYLEKGAVNEAIDALRRSVASQPAFCVGNFRLALAYEKKGETRAAREAFKRAVETERPGCRKIQEAWEGRGRVEKRLGMIDDARSSFERCVEISRTSTSGAHCDSGLRLLPRAAVNAQPSPPKANDATDAASSAPQGT